MLGSMCKTLFYSDLIVFMTLLCVFYKWVQSLNPDGDRCLLLCYHYHKGDKASDIILLNFSFKL